MPYSRLVLPDASRRRRNGWRRLSRAALRNALVIWREFRNPLLVFLIAVFGGGWLYGELLVQAGYERVPYVDLPYTMVALMIWKRPWICRTRRSLWRSGTDAAHCDLRGRARRVDVIRLFQPERAQKRVGGSRGLNLPQPRHRARRGAPGPAGDPRPRDDGHGRRGDRHQQLAGEGRRTQAPGRPLVLGDGGWWRRWRRRARVMRRRLSSARRTIT